MSAAEFVASQRAAGAVSAKSLTALVLSDRAGLDAEEFARRLAVTYSEEDAAKALTLAGAGEPDQQRAAELLGEGWKADKPAAALGLGTIFKKQNAVFLGKSIGGEGDGDGEAAHGPHGPGCTCPEEFGGETPFGGSRLGAMFNIMENPPDDLIGQLARDIRQSLAPLSRKSMDDRLAGTASLGVLVVKMLAAGAAAQGGADNGRIILVGTLKVSDDLLGGRGEEPLTDPGSSDGSSAGSSTERSEGEETTD
jgi:hypothetical protein